MSSGIDQLLTVAERLPEDRLAQVLDFARFLLWQAVRSPDEATSFELWAEGLARAKGFASLTEEEVARVVRQSRQGQVG